MTNFLHEFSDRIGRCGQDDLLMAGTFLGFAVVNEKFAVDSLSEPLSGNLTHDVITKGLGAFSVLGAVLSIRFSSNAFERATEENK